MRRKCGSHRLLHGTDLSLSPDSRGIRTSFFFRFLPFGHPPSFAFSRAAFAFFGVETLPMSAPTLISRLQCGHFILPQFLQHEGDAFGEFLDRSLPDDC